MFTKLRDLRLCAYIAEHYGERKTARQVLEGLSKKYTSQSGFSNPKSVGRILPRYVHQTIEKTNGAK